MVVVRLWRVRYRKGRSGGREIGRETFRSAHEASTARLRHCQTRHGACIYIQYSHRACLRIHITHAQRLIAVRPTREALEMIQLGRCACKRALSVDFAVLITRSAPRVGSRPWAAEIRTRAPASDPPGPLRAGLAAQARRSDPAKVDALVALPFHRPREVAVDPTGRLEARRTFLPR